MRFHDNYRYFHIENWYYVTSSNILIYFLVDIKIFSSHISNICRQISYIRNNLGEEQIFISQVNFITYIKYF